MTRQDRDGKVCGEDPCVTVTQAFFVLDADITR